MGITHYNAVLTDITDIVKQHLEEGASPEDVVLALEDIKFTMQMQRWKAAEAYSTLFLQGQKPPDDDDLVRR